MLHLASKSPRRLELLRQLGLEPRLLDVEVEERRGAAEAPPDYVERVAREKAQAGLAQLQGQPGALVLGADTEVVLGDIVYGKPADADDAARMLGELSGREHEVLTAVWVLNGEGAGRAVQRSRVRVQALAPTDIAWYLDSGEWRGKAGAYAIQGRFAAFIEDLSGSHSGVMGLPLHETHRLLRDAGLRW